MKNACKWLFLLNKRLYKKVTFVLILLMIPLLVFGYSFLARQESGVLTIALAQEGKDDTATAIMQELKESTNLIRFLICEATDTAEQMVSDGKADAAWIFADELENRIYRFVSDPSKHNAFVRIVERESSVPLMLSREKLSGAVFGCCSRALYLSYIREHVREMDDVSDETLMEHYDSISADTDLFEFSSMEGTVNPQEKQEDNYLLTPVRGLLAVVMVLSGMATAMYYIRDDLSGTFSWVPEQKKAFVELGYQMISACNVAVVIVLALIASGLSVSLGREVLAILLYGICTALFCMTLRRICKRLTVLSMLLPLLIVVMLVVCPVFFDIAKLRQLQYIFPPSYYVHGVYSDRFLLQMCIYCLVLFALYILAGMLRRKKG